MSSEKHSIVHLSLSIIFAVFIVTTSSIIVIQIGLNPSQIAMAQQQQQRGQFSSQPTTVSGTHKH